ncbi:hypothetical protein CLAIMM_10223 [Cladophialophora immunda]|nr:hypothetical protein CLAIMM_10223 [Cladophialophora immunda]
MVRMDPGPVVRTGPDEVIVNDPSVLDVIYGFGSKFQKTDFYRLFGFPDIWGVHVFSTIDRNHHSKLSRHIASAYTMTALVELEPLVDDCIDLFVKKITSHLSDPGPMNMAKWFQWYAFDVIGQLTFSTKFGFMEQEKDIENATWTIDLLLFYVSVIGQAFWLHWLLLGNPLVAWLTKSASSGSIIMVMANKQIRDRQARGSSHRDMLSRFLQEHEKKPDEYTVKDLHTTCAMNIAAGSDTTGIALTATLFHLLKNRHTLQKLRDEIDQFDDGGKLSRPAKLAETQSMPYLQAVIKESMRIHPSVAYIYPRYTRIGMNAYMMHRNKSIFGDDVELFRPERWLGCDTKRMDHYMFQFGAGPYTCMGKHISILEINKVIVELVRIFDISLVDQDFEFKLTNWWFLKPEDLPCAFTKRDRGVQVHV